MKFLKRARRDDRGDVDLLPADADPDMEAIEAELRELKSKKAPALPPPEDHDPRQKIHARRPDRHGHDEPLDLHDRHGHDKRHRPDTHRRQDAHDHSNFDDNGMVIDHEEHDDHDPHLPRTLQSKLFGIGYSGYFQLAAICVAMGAVLEASGINPLQPGFSFTAALGSIGTGALNVFGWVLQNGLWPLMIGALIVLPLWFVWRLLSVPFRH